MMWKENSTNNLTKSAGSLIDAITPAIEKLADIFNVSVGYIQENFQYYLLEYGKYVCTKETLQTVGILGLIFVAMSAYVAIIIWCEYEVENMRKIIKYIILIILFILIAITAFNTLPYLISPEMYSIEAVSKLIGN